MESGVSARLMVSTQRTRRAALAALVVVVAAATAGVGAVTAAPQEETAVVAAGGTVSADADSTVEVPIVIEGVPSDAPLIAVRGIDVSVANTSVAEVAHVAGPAFADSEGEPGTVRAGDFSGTGSMSLESRSSSHVNFTAAPITSSASGDVVLGYVRLNTTDVEGTTAIDISVREGRNASVGTVAFETEGATLDTTAPDNPFPSGAPGVGDTPPTDSNPRQPGFEDINGDGVANFTDVVNLLFAIDRLQGLSGPQLEAVDYDGNGMINFDDIVTLLFRL
jgi:hypothetical protein